MRKAGNTTPILMMTGKGSISDKEVGFETGADDYLTKPVNIRELGMRVKASLRRAAVQPSHQLEVGSLVLVPVAFRATKNGQDSVSG